MKGKGYITGLVSERKLRDFSLSRDNIDVTCHSDVHPTFLPSSVVNCRFSVPIELSVDMNIDASSRSLGTVKALQEELADLIADWVYKNLGSRGFEVKEEVTVKTTIK